MEKLLFFFAIVGFCGVQSCKNPCAGVDQYSHLNSDFTPYIFHVGSYWVYRDSSSGAIDSQYVYEYIKSTHKRNPIDTPNPFYGISATGHKDDYYCGPYYIDENYMNLLRFENGILTDTQRIRADATNELYFIEHLNGSNAVGSLIAYTDPTRGKYGNLGYEYFVYLGHLNTLQNGALAFNDIDVYRLQQKSVNSNLFSDTTDIYIAKYAGVVKRVSHIASGYKVWKLENYHTIQ